MKSIIVKFIRTSIIGAAVMLTAFSASAHIEGGWKNIQSFQPVGAMTSSQYNPVVKFIPASGRMYILAHSQDFRRGVWDYCGEMHLRLWYSTPQDMEKILPATDLYQLTGHDIRDCAYSGKAGAAIVVYEDGTIDLLRDNGSLKPVTALRYDNVPGANTVTGIFADSELPVAVITTTDGYAVIDLEKGEMTENHHLGVNVSAAARVGDRLILSAKKSDESNSILYEAVIGDDGKYPSSLSAMTPLTPEAFGTPGAILGSDGNVVNTIEIHPVAPGRVMLFGPGKSATWRSLTLLELDSDNEWKLLPIVDGPVFALTNNETSSFALRCDEGLCGSMPGGFCAKFSGNMHVIDGSVKPDYSLADPATAYKKAALRTLPVETSLNGFNATQSKMSTLDGSKFWMYGFNKGFYARIAADPESAGSSYWKSTSEVFLPDAPTVFHANRFDYNPEYGLLAVPRGYTNFFSLLAVEMRHQLCGYKNGAWTRYGQSYTNYANNNLFTMMGGVISDPDEPKYVYSVSYNGGIWRFNLENPQDLLHIAIHKSNYSASRKQDVLIENNVDALQYYLRYSDLNIDSYGNLWHQFYYHNNQGTTELYYWTPEDRRASYKAGSVGDNSAFRPWKRISLPGFVQNARQNLMTCRTEKNRNILLLTPGDYAYPVNILDHNGTLDDPTDDRKASLGPGFDDRGGNNEYDFIERMFEDPVDGRIWVLTHSGLFWFDVEEALGGSNVLHKPTLRNVDDGYGESLQLSNAVVLAMAADPSGRKWVATYQDGIYVISADNKVVEAHFLSDNSGLASNDVIGLGWNYENNSMMISTLEGGIQEFTPSFTGFEGTVVAEHAYPSEVKPDYHGAVTFSGLSDTAEYRITDKNGNTVAILGHPEFGRLQWLPVTKSGERVAPGNYYFRSDALSSEKTVLVRIL